VLLTLPPPTAPAAPHATDLSVRSPSVLGQLGRFTGIGTVMTLAYLALYAALQAPLGMQGANAVAWVVTAVADTSANRRLTFGLTGREGAARAQAEGLVVFGTGAAITSGSLLVLAAVAGTPGELLQLAVLVAANLAAGLLRFALLRRWVFAPWRRTAHRPSGAPAWTVR
jgi:putative flippase GtrA